MKLHLVAACVAFAPAVTLEARGEATQRGAPSNSLSRALGVFSITDADRDGKISATEARAIPVTPDELAKDDQDGDGAWSRDEFTLYYRARLLAGGQSVGADLDAEVARIQALKRLRVVEEARKQGAEGAGGRAEVEPIRVRFERALGDLEKSAAMRKATPEDFRRMRNLVILSGRSVPQSKSGNLPSPASARMLQTLDRIEKRTAAGQFAREDFEVLRTLVSTSATVEGTPKGAPNGPNPPTPSGGIDSSPKAGLPTNRIGPTGGPADARRRSTDPRGSTGVGPKPPPPESTKPPAPNPGAKPPATQDAKKDPGRRSKP